MEKIKISDLEVQPVFELEDYMGLCGESRIEGRTMEEIIKYWGDWLPKLKAKKLENGKNSWLAVWLPADIGAAIEDMRERDAIQGHMLNMLATYLCMAATGELAPQVAMTGCAPAPKKIPELEEALSAAGINGEDPAATPLHRIVTYFPYRGGCEICDSRDGCPKMKVDEAFSSIRLPGFEKGIWD